MQTSINREDILRMENTLLTAMKVSDISTLDKILHEDLLFMVPGGQVITKAMDLDSHRAGTMVIKKIIPEIESVNLIEDTAVVSLVYDTQGEMLGQPIEGKFRYIRVWKLFPDGWKVIAGSCTAL